MYEHEKRIRNYKLIAREHAAHALRETVERNPRSWSRPQPAGLQCSYRVSDAASVPLYVVPKRKSHMGQVMLKLYLPMSACEWCSWWCLRR